MCEKIGVKFDLIYSSYNKEFSDLVKLFIKEQPVQTGFLQFGWLGGWGAITSKASTWRGIRIMGFRGRKLACTLKCCSKTPRKKLLS